MRLLSTLCSIDSCPTTHLRRASEDGSEDRENEKLQTCQFTHGFCDDPARVGVVDDDFSFLGERGDLVGYFLRGIHFEKLREIVSNVEYQYINSKFRGRRRLLPVVHPSLLLVCKRLEDILLFALGKLRHPMDERCHEYEPNERSGLVFLVSRTRA